MPGLASTFDLSVAVAPADLQTAQTGKRVNLSLADSVDIVWFKGAGTAGDDPTMTVQSCTVATGGSPASLAVITEYYIKRATTLAGTESWVKVTQSAAATVVDPGGFTTSAEEQMIVVVHVRAEQLPAGSDYIGVNIADTGTNAQLGAVLYVLNGTDKGVPTDMRAALR